MVAAIKAGETVDPIHGFRGKQRSVHNTYFTLPVLFAMLSTHYSFTYGHPHNWLVLLTMMAAGAAIRQFFVLRHGFKLARNPHPWPYALAGVVLIFGVLLALRPAFESASTTKTIATSQGGSLASGTFSYSSVQPVLAQRCLMCHGETVQMKGVRLDSAQALAAHALQVYQQAVLTKTMPLNNATGITDAERGLIKQWFEGGARVD